MLASTAECAPKFDQDIRAELPLLDDDGIGDFALVDSLPQLLEATARYRGCDHGTLLCRRQTHWHDVFDSTAEV
jgi:hypothetical protein